MESHWIVVSETAAMDTADTEEEATAPAMEGEECDDSGMEEEDEEEEDEEEEEEEDADEYRSQGDDDDEERDGFFLHRETEEEALKRAILESAREAGKLLEEDHRPEATADVVARLALEHDEHVSHVYASVDPSKDPESTYKLVEGNPEEETDEMLGADDDDDDDDEDIPTTTTTRDLEEEEDKDEKCPVSSRHVVLQNLPSARSAPREVILGRVRACGEVESMRLFSMGWHQIAVVHFREIDSGPRAYRRLHGRTWFGARLAVADSERPTLAASTQLLVYNLPPPEEEHRGALAAKIRKRFAAFGAMTRVLVFGDWACVEFEDLGSALDAHRVACLANSGRDIFGPPPPDDDERERREPFPRLDGHHLRVRYAALEPQRREFEMSRTLFPWTVLGKFEAEVAAHEARAIRRERKIDERATHLFLKAQRNLSVEDRTLVRSLDDLESSSSSSSEVTYYRTEARIQIDEEERRDGVISEERVRPPQEVADDAMQRAPSRDVEDILRELNLTSYRQHFVDYGAETISDLLFLTEGDCKQMGMPPLKRRRLSSLIDHERRRRLFATTLSATTFT